MNVAIDLKLPSNEILLFNVDGSYKFVDRQEIMGTNFILNQPDHLSKRSFRYNLNDAMKDNGALVNTAQPSSNRRRLN